MVFGFMYLQTLIDLLLVKSSGFHFRKSSFAEHRTVMSLVSGLYLLHHIYASLLSVLSADLCLDLLCVIFPSDFLAKSLHGSYLRGSDEC
jgi:ABC-type iron transport system FetAB permease component